MASALLGLLASTGLAGAASATDLCAIETFELPDGQVGAPYPGETMEINCVTIADDSVGGAGAATFSSTPLPDGLAIDPLTGDISGTPTTPVVDLPVTITRTWANGYFIEATDTITILPLDPGVPLAHPAGVGAAALAAAAAVVGARRRRLAL